MDAIEHGNMLAARLENRMSAPTYKLVYGIYDLEYRCKRKTTYSTACFENAAAAWVKDFPETMATKYADYIDVEILEVDRVCIVMRLTLKASAKRQSIMMVSMELE